MRIPYFDFLRGVAIIMVVFIHCFGICYSCSSVGIPVVTIRNLLNVAVPLFFAISGFFLASKKMENGGYVQFLKRQIPKVYIPTMFCSLIYLCRDLENGVVLPAFLNFFFCGYSIYYFIFVIIQFYLLLWFLQKNISTLLVLISFVLGAVWWFFNSYWGWGVDESLPLLFYAGNVIPWGFYFILGMFLAKRPSDVFPYKMLCGMAVVFVAVAVVESFYIIDSTHALNGVGQKISCFVLNAFLCIILFRKDTISFFSSYKETALFRTICFLGRFSFGIYLIHYYMLGLAWKIESLISCQFAKWIVCSLLVLSVSIVVLVVMKKLCPKMSKIFLGV
jgi:peptidoglycan/LPS O-acetylase OafA/YrhL